jgi:hypothetical protein
MTQIKREEELKCIERFTGGESKLDQIFFTSVANEQEFCFLRKFFGAESEQGRNWNLAPLGLSGVLIAHPGLRFAAPWAFESRPGGAGPFFICVDLRHLRIIFLSAVAVPS